MVVAIPLVWAQVGVTNASNAQIEAQVTHAGQPTFGLSQVAALQPEIGGYPLWQYCASLLWICCAFVVAPVMD